MMRCLFLFLALTAATVFAAGPSATAVLPLAKNDTILFYGNSMVERLLEAGTMEAYLQLAHPDKNLRVRSLAWTGDEVGHRLRAEGYVEHLKTLLAKWPANVVVLGYGMNESFGGTAGLAEFRSQFDAHLREVARLHPQAKLVLLSPIAVEGDERRNGEIAAYSAAIADLAKARGALFVDLFTASTAAYAKSAGPLTVQGIHLNDAGNREMGEVIARALLGDAAVAGVPTWRLEDVAKAAAQKSRAVADIVRPKNGVVYYGVRKRPEEYAAEMPRYHQLIEQADQILHDLVSKPSAHFADFPAPSLPPMPEGQSKTDRFGGGVVKAPAEQQQDLKVADGYTLNLFASEVDFPDLKSPVQVAFDARGRLWVVTMPSFPHTVPGAVPRDKILILEDTDRDGKADKSTVFADGFDALDGVAFHERGVIVSAQPRLLLLKDNDGDGRADSQTELLRGVDVTDSHHGGMVATDPLGHVFFCDGVFHRSQFETPFGVVRGVDSATYRLDPRSGRIAVEWQSMTPNPWKVAFGRYGNIFQRYGGGHVLEGLPLTWTPLGAYHTYGHGTVVNYGKGSALSVISSPNFPAEYQQGVASATLLGNYFVSLSKANADGGPIVGTDRLDVVSSTNAAFRPVDCEFGFDGALYISDFSSRIIGHAQHPMRDPQWNHEKGRIWRVVHNGKPVAKDWPNIEGATVPQLLALLTHPQDIVRHHARIRLRGLGSEVVPALDAWVAAKERSQPDFDQAALEALWVLNAHGEVRPALLASLLKSANPQYRAAAVQLIRFQAERLPDALNWLTTAAQDPHPRVRMAVVNVVAHLRPQRPQFEAALAKLNATEPPVQQMLADLKLGTKPIRGRSVPVLEVSPETKVKQWLALGDSSAAPPVKGKAAPPKTLTYRTFVEAAAAQTALLSVKHGFLDISANGVQLLSADSQWSSEQQVQVELQRGLNSLEITFRRAKPTMPPVFLYDLLGQPLTRARLATNAAGLKAFAAAWDATHAADANALRVQAVPNLMQFAPRQLHAKPGAPVRIIFENPDLMQHNFVLVAAGADEEIGLLADQMATRPYALAKQYLPDSKKILQATALVNPNGRAELNFTAPAQPGRYPYLCTFPGHWRVMRGVLIVADNLADFLAKNPEAAPKITEWKLADFADDLKRVGTHRNFARGQQQFTALACAQCHQLGKEGVAFGPSLSDVVKKYKGDAKLVLQEILEPSKTVEEKYRNVTLELGDENSLSGLILAEDAASVTIQTGPAANQIQKVAKSAIKSRKASALSLMPAALLNSLDKEQVLDLLAYLLAEGKADHAAFKHAH
jgi:putative heme-binding domain-containing protein